MTTVFATPGARRYHSRRDCRGLEIGQDLNDWECPDDYCRHDHPRPGPVLEYLLEGSVVRHREPCGVCKPALPPLVGSLGHEPIEYDGALICQRCYLGDDNHRDFVYWPCATARVLQLKGGTE